MQMQQFFIDLKTPGVRSSGAQRLFPRINELFSGDWLFQW
jgi:hypothetical protein